MAKRRVEYKVEEAADFEAVESELNRMASLGWTFVAFAPPSGMHFAAMVFIRSIFDVPPEDR